MRYAFRRLRRAPGFTCAVVLTLALGTACSTAVFGIVRAVAARIVPPIDLSHLWVVRVRSTMNGLDQLGLPLREYQRAASPLADADITAAISDLREQMVISAAGRAERVQVEAVSGSYARVFGLRPEAGRWIDGADDEGDGRAVAVIGARLWRSWFGADRAIVGHQSVQINGARFGIVGVAADDFRGVQPSIAPPEIWIPESAKHDLYPPRDPLSTPVWFVTVILKAPETMGRAELQTRLTSALAGGSLSHAPDRLKTRVEPAWMLYRDAMMPGVIALVLAVLVLGAACANVGNLLYARGREIRGELAIRQSLGATRGQLVKVLLSEALLIGAAASGVGCAGAIAAMRAFGALFPMFLVGRSHYTSLPLSPDWQVFACATVCGMFSGAVMGLVTGFGASRRMPAVSMKTAGSMTGARYSGGRTTLVAVQVTAAMLLVMATGIVLENAPSDLSARILYDAQTLTVAGVDLAHDGYNQTTAGGFFDRLLESARQVPGVERAALASAVPGGVGTEAPEIVWLVAPTRNNVSGATRRIEASAVAVSPTFFDTTGIRVERGRAFTRADSGGAPLTAILSRSAAGVLFPSRDPLGLPVTYGFQGRSLTVVGVVSDPVTGPSDQAPFAQPSNFIFIPLAQHPRLDARLVLRAPAAGAFAGPLRNVVRSLDERVGLFQPTRITESRLAWAAPLNAARVLLLAGAAAGLTIALLGIYGMLTYFVSLRSREFGIRMALGATRRQVARLVFDHTLHIMLVGLLAGVLITTLSSRVLEHTLVQLMPNEIRTWAIVPILVLVTGVVAGCIPALRASRIDPNAALREF
jgi:putative ABC transport system permease protein